MTEKLSLPKLIELAERAADDLCKGQLTILKSEEGWKVWLGIKTEGYTDELIIRVIGITPTLEEALDQALRRLLTVTIKNLNVMLDMLEFPNLGPDPDDDAA